MYILLRKILFLFNPEGVHHFSMNMLQLICKLPYGKKLLAAAYTPITTAPTKFCNIRFKNKVGLAAGFDKNATYLNELEALGFGFVEIGTVTPLPQAGNPTPRLFRLPKDKALINRMGFNNDGAIAIAARLQKWQENNSTSTLTIGGNIGKNKITANEDAWKDYEICFTTLHPYVHYFVVNVSSPNTPGLRALQDKPALQKILTNLQLLNNKTTNPKPILLKIAPDLTNEQLDDVIDLALEIQLHGLVAANTSITRSNLQTNNSLLNTIGSGGISGLPVQKRSTEMVAYIHKKTNGKIPIIASGGIFTAADAQQKMNAGATLVQVWTGFVYQGPTIVKKICNCL